MKLFIGMLCALLAWCAVVGGKVAGNEAVAEADGEDGGAAGGEAVAEAGDAAGGEAVAEAGGEAGNETVAETGGRAAGQAGCGCDYHMEPVCATNERSYANPCIMECAGAKFWKHGGCKQHPHF